jgi:hypothetical protein
MVVTLKYISFIIMISAPKCVYIQFSLKRTVVNTWEALPGAWVAFCMKHEKNT